MPLDFIYPEWPVPKNVKCVATTRASGFSKNNYQSLNLGGHVKDSEEFVEKNRVLLRKELKLPSDPVWLNQIHGTDVIELNSTVAANNTADASYTSGSSIVCTILTADCLPVVFCDQKGEYIAATHAGWRGLVNGVLENTLKMLPVDNDELMCWFGPAIGPENFEVGSEVVQQFIGKDVLHENAFNAKANDNYFADIYQLARNILEQHGVHRIYGGSHCTYRESEKFYSYRRDGETGRMATLIWKE